MKNLISVIITTYNRRMMLETAIKSVISQKNVELELIIIDDNSTDDTVSMVEHLQFPSQVSLVFIKNQKNYGLLYNHSVGFKRTNGDFVIFMDDDDYYTDKNFFKRAINKLNEDESLSFVASNVEIKYEKDGRITQSPLNISGFITKESYLSNFQFKYSKPLSTFPAVFRKSKLLEAGFENMKVMNDSSIYMRSLLAGNSFIFLENIGIYRLHGDNRSCDNGSYFLQNLQEKYRILEEGKHIIRRPKHWWYNQFTLTYKYYASAKHQIKDEKEIIDWGLEHNGGSILLRWYLRFRKYRLSSC